MCVFLMSEEKPSYEAPPADSPSHLSGQNRMTCPVLNHSLARGMQPTWLAHADLDWPPGGEQSTSEVHGQVEKTGTKLDF